MTKNCFKNIEGSNSQISQYDKVYRQCYGKGMSKGKDHCR